MSLLLWMALLPCYLDADAPIWPPVHPSDYDAFGAPGRFWTMETWRRSEWQRKDFEEIDPAVFHIDRVSYHCELVRLQWVELCWCVLDDAALSDRCPRSKVEHLTRLRRLLGPLNYYRGVMPTVPMEVQP